MTSAAYNTGIYSKALLTSFMIHVEANTMNPGQTVPNGAVRSVSILLQYKLPNNKISE